MNNRESTVRIKLTLLLAISVVIGSLSVFIAQADAIFGCTQDNDYLCERIDRTEVGERVKVTPGEREYTVYINPRVETVWFQGWPAPNCWLYSYKVIVEDDERVVGYRITTYKDENNVEHVTIEWIVPIGCTYENTRSHLD